MTKSFAEDPIIAGIRCDVDAVESSHSSTKLCSVNVGRTGCPIHIISICNMTLTKSKATCVENCSAVQVITTVNCL